MSRSVIVLADVSATKSSTDTVNTWVPAGPLAPVLAQKITVGRQPLVLSASQVFNGQNNSSGVATPPSPVKLEAGATKLRDAGTSVLLDGDSATDPPGNKVSASGAHKIASS